MVNVEYALVSVFSILVGASILGFWARLYAKKQIFEAGTRTPIEAEYHIAAELSTAATLIIGGAALLTKISFGASVTLTGFGMLIYANINGPGYYAAKGDKRMVRIFSVTLIVALIFTTFLIMQFS